MTNGVDGSDLKDRVAIGRGRVRLVLSGCACATGGALVVHITSKVSLALAVVSLFAVAAGVFGLVVHRLDPARQVILRRQMRVGAAAGLLATIAYDVARFGTVAALDLSFEPFHVFELFGQALLGADVSGPIAFGAGAAYHLTNGMGFGIAFALLVRRPTIAKGLLWAMFLELAMAVFYPSWLQLQAVGEFLQVSVVGHAVYGVTLAVLTRRWLVTSVSPEPGAVHR